MAPIPELTRQNWRSELDAHVGTLTVNSNDWIRCGLVHFVNDTGYTYPMLLLDKVQVALMGRTLANKESPIVLMPGLNEGLLAKAFHNATKEPLRGQLRTHVSKYFVSDLYLERQEQWFAAGHTDGLHAQAGAEQEGMDFEESQESRDDNFDKDEDEGEDEDVDMAQNPFSSSNRAGSGNVNPFAGEHAPSGGGDRRPSASTPTFSCGSAPSSASKSGSRRSNRSSGRASGKPPRNGERRAPTSVAGKRSPYRASNMLQSAREKKRGSELMARRMGRTSDSSPRDNTPDPEGISANVLPDDAKSNLGTAFAEATPEKKKKDPEESTSVHPSPGGRMPGSGLGSFAGMSASTPLSGASPFGQATPTAANGFGATASPSMAAGVASAGASGPGSFAGRSASTPLSGASLFGQATPTAANGFGATASPSMAAGVASTEAGAPTAPEEGDAEGVATGSSGNPPPDAGPNASEQLHYLMHWLGNGGEAPPDLSYLKDSDVMNEIDVLKMSPEELRQYVLERGVKAVQLAFEDIVTAHNVVEEDRRTDVSRLEMAQATASQVLANDKAVKSRILLSNKKIEVARGAKGAKKKEIEQRMASLQRELDDLNAQEKEIDARAATIAGYEDLQTANVAQSKVIVDALGIPYLISLPLNGPEWTAIIAKLPLFPHLGVRCLAAIGSVIPADVRAKVQWDERSVTSGLASVVRRMGVGSLPRNVAGGGAGGGVENLDDDLTEFSEDTKPPATATSYNNTRAAAEAAAQRGSAAAGTAPAAAAAAPAAGAAAPAPHAASFAAPPAPQFYAYPQGYAPPQAFPPGQQYFVGAPYQQPPPQYPPQGAGGWHPQYAQPVWYGAGGPPLPPSPPSQAPPGGPPPAPAQQAASSTGQGTQPTSSQGAGSSAAPNQSTSGDNQTGDGQ